MAFPSTLSNPVTLTLCASVSGLSWGGYPLRGFGVIARNYTSMKFLTGLPIRVRMFVRIHEKMHEYLCEKSNPIPLTWGGYSYEG